MIAKLFRKIILLFSLAATLLGNTGLFSLAKTKQTAKEVLSEKPIYVFEEKLQCREKKTVFNYRNSTNPKFEKPDPILALDYQKEEVFGGLPLPEQSTFAYAVDGSTTSMQIVFVNVDYTTWDGIQSIEVELSEPREFLAKNLNQECKDVIIFSSNKDKGKV